MISKVYGGLAAALANKQLNLLSDPLSVMLLSSAYTPSQAHAYSDVIGYEIAAGGGYTTGGQALTNVAPINNFSGQLAGIDADDPTWAGSTITARHAVFYAPNTSSLLVYWDFQNDVSSSGSDFTLTIHTAGLLTLVAD